MSIDQAQARLHAGQLIACPTESVWGLSCDPNNQTAVMQLLALKQRPLDKGLILVAAQLSQIAPLLQHLKPEELQRLNTSWPGAHTWLIEDPLHWSPQWIRGHHTAVAVRISAHPTLRALCQAFGGPIVSTSANPSSLPPAKTAQQVKQYFPIETVFILNGSLGLEVRPTKIQCLHSMTEIRA